MSNEPAVEQVPEGQSGVMNFFPKTDKFTEPYPNQRKVIEAVEKNYRNGYQYVILESPVGSGKSAIALTLARFYGSAHFLIPRKILQDQYINDFNDYMVPMKGKSSYLCSYLETESNYLGDRSCSAGGGSQNKSMFDSDHKKVLSSEPVCPWAKEWETCRYRLALEEAADEPITVHNFWSFIFQTRFSSIFQPRNLMVVDEAHMMEDILRGFATKETTLGTIIPEKDFPEEMNKEDWFNFLTQDKFLPKDKDSKDRYLDSFQRWLEEGPDNFVPTIEHQEDRDSTKVKLIPNEIGWVGNKLLFPYAENNRVLFMSGTIYEKDRFCKTHGLPKDKTCFIRVGSTFPARYRPIYMRDKVMVDTSFKYWEENLPEIKESIETIFNKFPDCKGVIQAPSYKGARDIVELLDNDRILTHQSSSDFSETLEEFYRRDDNTVLVSPTIQQGVDFKEDKARFQVMVRVPYPNAGDAFIKFKMQKDFSWYNHQALVTFGQQLGRINRAPQDYGATILLDERFKNFIKRNKSKIPKWVQEAIHSDS